MNTDTFEHTIYSNWAGFFGCTEEDIHQPGTTLHPEERFRANGLALVCSVGRHTFIRLDPELLDLVRDAASRFSTYESISATALASALGSNRIQSHDRTLIYYLEPHALPESVPMDPFVIRQLSTADAEALDALKATCTPFEIEDGFVEVDHQIAFGCFEGDILASAASGYERTGFMDIGVLTHSGYRRIGLGKSVVKSLCRWSFDNGYIPQYRHAVENINSQHVARGLNFKVYAEEEGLWIK